MPENIFEINEVNFKSEVKDVSGPCLVDSGPHGAGHVR